MMTTLHLLLLSFIIIISGANKITTIKEVPVREGQSIIIPCLYDPIYKSYSKYLCSGYFWDFCKYKVYSDLRKTNSKMSITDDQERRTINVTMNSLSSSEAGYYWCCIEIHKASDEGRWFKLQVKKDPELYVKNQTVSGNVGQTLSISCHHHHRANEEKKWCKLGGNCVENTGTLDGASVQLNKTDKILKIKMSNLMMKNTGWYYCSVGNLQMPVHVSVTNISKTSKLESKKQAPNNLALNNPALNNPALNNLSSNNTAPNNTAASGRSPDNDVNLVVLTVCLGVMVPFVCAVVTLIMLLKKKYKSKTFKEHDHAENIYVSMRLKPQPEKQNQCEEKKGEEDETYVTMSGMKK